jgi:nicotinate-nucleotide adenylyltransferase
VKWYNNPVKLKKREDKHFLRIGLFGGSFDPPHNGHINAAKKAKADLSLDRLIIVPAFVSPFKTDKAGTPPELRFKMCEAAFGEFADISDFEIKREEISYTIDTVYYIKELYPDSEIFLIGGTDIKSGFDHWKDSDKLKKLTKLYIIPRDIIPVSSTEIREKIRSGEETAALVTPEVGEIIKKQKLYY